MKPSFPDVPDRLMEDPEVAAPEIDDVGGDVVDEDPVHPELPTPSHVR